MSAQPTRPIDKSTAARATVEQVIASCALVAVFGVLWRFGASGKAAAAIVFVITLTALAIIDVRTRTLPDVITAPLLVVGVTVNAFHVFTAIAGALDGAAVGFGLLWGANQLYRLRRNRHAIGGGDMKLAAAAGAWLGVAEIWQALAIASVCMFAWGLATRDRAGVSAQGAVPFGPIISFACAVSLLFPLGNIR